MPKHPSTPGRLTVLGKTLNVAYDIPGLEHPETEIAGGLIWFDPTETPPFVTRLQFHLETATGLTVQGSFVKIHKESASVIVDL